MFRQIAPSVLLALTLLGCVYQPRSVCVLDFQIITADSEYTHLSRAIPEFLTTELANTPNLRVREPQDVDRLLSTTRQRWTLRDHSRLRGLGRALHTDYLLLGSVTRLGENFVIESRLYSVARGHVVPGTAVRETCRSEQDILVQVRSIAEQLRYQIVARSLRPQLGG